MMNAKSKMKVFYAEGIIEMNTTFAKMTQNPLSDEYALLQKTRMENPTFTVRRRQIKTNPKKDTYKGLTYDYMEYLYLKKTSLISKAVNAINIGSLFKRVDVQPTHIATVAGVNYPNGLRFVTGVIVPKCATKAGYREYLPLLINHGLSVKEAADACGISPSYAYKLLKAK